MWARTKAWVLRLAERMGRHRIPRLSAAISFNAMLALSPTLVFGVLIAGKFLGDARTLNEILDTARGIVGPDGAELVRTLARQTRDPAASQLAATFGTLVAFFGSSNLFLSLLDASETIWDLKITGHPIVNLFKTRIFALGGVLLFGLVLIAWIAFDTVAQTPGQLLDARFSQQISFLVSVLYLTLACAVFYKFIPFRLAPWRMVWLGSFVAALGISLLKNLLSTFFATLGITQIYGGAAAFIATLLTINYMVTAFLLGMEIVAMQTADVANQLPEDQNAGVQ